MAGAANMRDVARLAGVSPGTVSRVLNNRMNLTRVSAETRQRIFAAVKELDYVPNINARRLFDKRSGILGLVLPYFEEPDSYIFDDQHLVRIIKGIERVISARDYRLLLIFADTNFIRHKDYLNIFRSKQVDGIFIWGASRTDSFYQELSENSFPHVFITNKPDYLADHSIYFQSDYRNASKQVMRHLLENGHRRIAWCANPDDLLSLQQELNCGIRELLAEYRLDWDEVIVPLHCSYNYTDGYWATQKIVDEKLPVTAILTVSCNSARGCYDYLLQHGKRVPDDYALACCDSVARESISVQFTRAICNDDELGDMAAKRLLGLLHQEPPPEPAQNFIPVIFERGDSS